MTTLNSNQNVTTVLSILDADGNAIPGATFDSPPSASVSDANTAVAVTQDPTTNEWSVTVTCDEKSATSFGLSVSGVSGGVSLTPFTDTYSVTTIPSSTPASIGGTVGTPVDNVTASTTAPEAAVAPSEAPNPSPGAATF